MPTTQNEDGPAPFASRMSDSSDMAAIQEFIDEGVVTAVLGVVKSGKEATVYRCRAHRSVGKPIVAAKVYHDSQFRGFGKDTVYNDGRVILNGQVRRAVANKSAAGRGFAAAMWANREFDTLSALYDAGADVPEPLFATDRAVLMEYLGDAEGAATQLHHVSLGPDEAPAVLERLLWNIELWLNNDVVHADLSPFNVLHHAGRVTVIDFPQAVDPRFNTHARDLLTRDLRNVCRHFARYGLETDHTAIVDDLWRRFTLGDLG